MEADSLLNRSSCVSETAEHSLGHSPNAYCASDHRLSLYQHARGRKVTVEVPSSITGWWVPAPSLYSLGPHLTCWIFMVSFFPIYKVGIILLHQTVTGLNINYLPGT